MLSRPFREGTGGQAQTGRESMPPSQGGPGWRVNTHSNSPRTVRLTLVDLPGSYSYDWKSHVVECKNPNGGCDGGHPVRDRHRDSPGDRREEKHSERYADGYLRGEGGRFHSPIQTLRKGLGYRR